MASRGWEGITQTDISRRQAAARAPAPRAGRGHKFNAEPCIVAADGTLFTAADIATAELASTHPLIGTGTLLQRGERLGIVGTWFASTKEGRRYIALRHLATAGVITDLRCQVPYDLTVISEVDGGRHVVGRLIVDFKYRRDGADIAEDVKGATTLPIAKLKMKMLEAQYGIKVHEVRATEG